VASAGETAAEQPTPGDATVIVSAAGRYLEASPAALELFGVRPGDLHELRAADVGTFVPDAFAMPHGSPGGSGSGQA
jgi:PAS domain-containing protein